MKSILDLLFSNHFVIDEQKEKIYEQQKVNQLKENKKGTEQEDLITLISRVMVENERLLDIRNKLETGGNSPEFMEDFMSRMVTLLDGFERILNLGRQYPPSEEVDNWLKSVETIYFRLFHMLEKYGLKPLDTIGKNVDLNYHDVVEYRRTIDYPPDTIISERQKGYFFNNKLLRDAKVVVAYNPKAN